MMSVNHDKNILYIGGFILPDKNAAAQRVMAMGKTLRSMGFSVSFVGMDNEGISCKSIFDGFPCDSLPYPVTTNEWFRHIWEFIPLKRIEEFSPNYVFLYNFPAIASLRILRYCHRHGIKVFHDTTEWELVGGHSSRDIIKKIDTRLRMKFCLKKMDGIIAISRYLYDYYKNNVNTVIIPPTVDLDDEKWKRDRELTAESVIKLVYAGSAGAKCKDRLDRVIEVVSQTENIELKVIGLSEEQYVADFGIIPNNCKNVTFMGRVPHNDAVQAVQSADFQVLIRENTLKNQAGFPTKFVESISCCTPLITTLSSNIGDYLVDGKNGFIVNENNTLSDVITRVSQMSIEERIEMKRFCRDNNQFDYHNFISELQKLFK